MCGIVGIYTCQRDEVIHKNLLWEMMEPLETRGPDGQFVWRERGVGLGHLRLSILDLKIRSNQPMVDPETGCCLTYNGEIYNFLELREELIGLGYFFQTTGDAEVILKAYDAWGEACLNRFNGMWAFALYDPKNDTLFCARDRFGVKPFVYAIDQGNLVFASESKAIVAGFPHLKIPNLPFLRQFVKTGEFANSQATFYQPIKNLLPGHSFVMTRGEIPHPKRYWTWQPKLENVEMSQDACLEQFQLLLTDAIRLRFRSDVPVGVCLSGGLDSSAIVALASRIFNTPISTFSCVYPEFPKMDETPYIQEVVNTFQCDAHLVSPDVPDLIPAMIQSVWEQDGPTGTPAVLSQRAVMSIAQGQVKVLLDGQGADELLGGYHSYFNSALKTLVRELYRRPSIARLLKYWRAAKAIESRTGKPAEKFRRLLRGVRKPAAFRKHPSDLSVLNSINPYRQDDLNTVLLEDFFYNSLPQLLHYEDRNSMAFSLESRLPFLDYRLVEFLFSLPHFYKIRDAQTKFLLSESMKNVLPEKVLWRREKLGYETPGQYWFSDQKARLYLDEFLLRIPAPLTTLDRVDLEEMQLDWNRCKNRVPIPPHRERVLWRFFTACLWLQQIQTPGKNPTKTLAKSFVPTSVHTGA
ncbi:MAG: asparagine synthase (glutamine-hydrolyzing) [Cyanobacteria bacterium]|nr:asparagine synthase (glutamine-hydrolyzing) [Cyanobacteriota bacterium]